MLFEKSNKSRFIIGIRKRIGKMFSKLELSPNQWTILSLVFSLTAAFFLFQQKYLISALFIIVSGAMDLIDGAVAREKKQTTIRGAYLDTVIDRYNEFIYLLPLLFLNLQPIVMPFYIWITFLLFGGMMTTYAKSAAAEKGVKSEIKGGILERAERVGLLVIALIIAEFNILLFEYMIVVLAILANISALQRIQKAFQRS